MIAAVDVYSLLSAVNNKQRYQSVALLFLKEELKCIQSSNGPTQFHPDELLISGKVAAGGNSVFGVFGSKVTGVTVHQKRYPACSVNLNGLSSTHSRSLVRRARRSSSTSRRECSRAACCSALFSTRFRLSHLVYDRGAENMMFGLFQKV